MQWLKEQSQNFSVPVQIMLPIRVKVSYKLKCQLALELSGHSGHPDASCPSQALSGQNAIKSSPVDTGTRTEMQALILVMQ